MKYFICLCLLWPMMATHAGELTQDGRSLLYPASEDYATTVENIKMAIADQGLNVSNTLHISDMLNRTAKDLDIKKTYFFKPNPLNFAVRAGRTK